MRIRTKVFGSLEHIVCYSLLACVMTLTLSSCSAATQETHVVSEAKTVSELRAPYASSDAYEFASDPIVVDQDGAITFKTDYDTNFTGDGFSSWEVKFKDYGLDSPFVLYADADLSVIEQIYDGSSIKEGGAITISPDGLYEVGADLRDEKGVVAKDSKGNRIRLTFSGNGTWGTSDTKYLVQYNDLKTGKLLDKPIVHLIRINQPKEQLNAPAATMCISEEGNLTLEWKPVEGAARYAIVMKMGSTSTVDSTAKKEQ